jgi:membrane protein implicated in regulation of membrane protease activity
MWIYAGIAILGIILLLSMLLVGELFGGDHEISHDIAAGHDIDGGGPSIFSTRIIAAFLTAFGVGGVVGRYYNLSHPVSAAIGVVFGVIMAGAVYQFAKILYSQQASSEVRMTTLVGTTAEVSVAIPQNGVGQIVVYTRGERTEHIARSSTGAAIARGLPVTIASIGGDSVLVTPVAKADGGN